MTPTQLARAAGETVHAVRYYTRIGLLVPADVSQNGYRRFDPSALARLAFIRHAQQLGFALDEISQIADEAKRGLAPCTRVRTLLRARLPVVVRHFEDSRALLTRMLRAERRWRLQPDRAPTGHEICHLIESQF
jgi:DNA-binding transcriptional MerR regulator